MQLHLDCSRAYIGKLEAEGVIQRQGDGFPLDQRRVATSKAEGMGMGLSIARTIIVTHNGQLSAKNRDHGGATFKIRLPLVS